MIRAFNGSPSCENTRQLHMCTEYPFPSKKRLDNNTNAPLSKHVKNVAVHVTAMAVNHIPLSARTSLVMQRVQHPSVQQHHLAARLLQLLLTSTAYRHLRGCSTALPMQQTATERTSDSVPASGTHTATAPHGCSVR
jgi:hypothetical protein